MSDYISREAFLRWAREFYPGPVLISGIINAPGADVEPVVRCRECKYSYESISGRCCTMGPCVDCIVPEDFFCSYGKREED